MENVNFQELEEISKTEVAEKSAMIPSQTPATYQVSISSLRFVKKSQRIFFIFKYFKHIAKFNFLSETCVMKRHSPIYLFDFLTDCLIAVCL